MDKMLQDVALEHHIKVIIGKDAKISAAANVGLHALNRILGKARVHVQRMFFPSPDVVDEIAVPGPHVEHSTIEWHIGLKVAAYDLPYIGPLPVWDETGLKVATGGVDVVTHGERLSG
jgi:hypothetical protein